MIIPRPTAVEERPGAFLLGPSVNLSSGPGAGRPAALLAGLLGDRPSGADSPAVHIGLDGSGPPEGYRLDIGTDEVRLTAHAEAGLFHGVQTLRALREASGVDGWPCMSIVDAPRLAWRGAMLDVARHFMPIGFLHEFVDELARHKLNTLHLHLTDDQGWRVEIDGYPRLTEVGAWRAESMVGAAGSGRYDGRPHGGYYTQAQLRGLVRYAADRGVTVVPEIEMPGHARALLAAYPHLGNRPDRPLPVWTGWGVSEDILGVQDETLEFLREVLTQVVDVFPSRYVHLGGDECPTGQWESSPAARRRAAELGLPGPARLHGWLLGQMRDVLAGHGRRAVCWEERGEDGGLPRDVVLAPWRHPDHAIAPIAAGHQVVMVPYQWTFLDYPQRDHPDEPFGQPDHLITLEDVYRFDPLEGLPVSTVDGPGVLGTQAQLWTEFAPTPAHVRYLAFPRLCALAEAAWSGPGGGYVDFQTRLAAHRHRTDEPVAVQ